mgnify:CR=1 FL=1
MVDGGRGEPMETIARIPELAATLPAEATARSLAPAASGRRRPRFPVWSVAGLAVVAAVAWVLASRHEQERLARQRLPARIAQQPTAAPDSITP